MKQMTDIDNNQFALILYNKPILDPKAGFFGKLSYKFKERKYRKREAIPVYEMLKGKEPSFTTLIDFSDFIKIIEKVFFYNNEVPKEPSIKLLSDNSYKGSDEIKKIIIANTEDNVFITLELQRDFVPSLEDYADIINITVKNEFGKKIKTMFTIINTQISIDNKDDYNLLFNINRSLMKLMSELFMKYYLKA